MNKRILLIILLLISISISQIFAQKDSSNLIKYSADYEFADGLYLSGNKLKKSLPINKSSIVCDYSLDDYEFFVKLLKNPTIKFFDDNGTEREISTNKIWAYCDNGILYIFKGQNFNRVSYIGSICHFTAHETVITNYMPYYDPYSYYNPYSYNSAQSYKTEIRQYVYDFESDKIYEYTPSNLKIIFMRDPFIHDEYMNLRRRKRIKFAFKYIRKFNERNPLYLINKNL